MKQSLFLLSLLAVAKENSAAPVLDCEAQVPCLRFNYTCFQSAHGEVSDCPGGDPCSVEVCMTIDTTADGCAKQGGGISHVCDGSDESGCPYGTDANGDIQFDTNDYHKECPAFVGHGVHDTGIPNKCDDVSNIIMCQEAHPGEFVYFVLKDGKEEDIPNYINETVYVNGTVVNGIEIIAAYPPIQCTNGIYNCDKPDPGKAFMERTYKVFVPDMCECNGPAPTASMMPSPEPTSLVKSAPPFVVPNLPPALPPAITPTGSLGDPHFRTWKNEHFEYHGQCDLVLAKDKNFADGLGVEVHIRTKLVRFWSYIKQAVIRIGDDILEVEGGSEEEHEEHYWINLEYQGKLTTIGGFPVTTWWQNTFKRHYLIDLSSKYPGQKIQISTYKEFVRVDFKGATEESFGNVVGILGDFNTGKTFARDGVTEMNDFTDLGNEWQVLPADDVLFHDVSDPQFPKKCIEPEDPIGQRRRRLSESSVTEEQAEKACAHLKDKVDQKDCVYDILATQDLGMVGAY